MNKLYDRIDFVNNTAPALNETNLDLMSKAIDDIDDRVIDIAGDVLVVVPEILDKYADIEALATNPPYIGNNGHWWTWDTDLNQYVDSGVDAGVSVNVGTTTTLTPGSSATVTNSGTDTDPILNFGIPQGAAGQDGTDGQDGVSPEVTIGTITGGHSVTITDADHPIGQSFNVMDGQDGAAGVGVPSGGATGQVLKKKSGTDYDTEWANESGGGSGGHTIINDAGTSMTQRTGLQFVGADVMDDPVNDKTIVTTTPQSMIGDAWVNDQYYTESDLVIDGSVLYECLQNHTSTAANRPPYASYWRAVKVADIINDVYMLVSSFNPSLVYLYFKGEENPYVCQWVFYPQKSLGYTSGTKYDTYIDCRNGQTITTNRMINLKGYTKLHIHVKAVYNGANWWQSLYLSTDKDGNNEVLRQNLDTTGDVVIDISSINNGAYYITVIAYAGSGRYIQFDEVYLTKN